MSRSLRIRGCARPDAAQLGPTAQAWLAQLGGPTLLEIAGRDRSRVRALATLLHGNEPSGVHALHAWLASGEVPAVDVLCFVGAVEAALAPPGFHWRHLPERRDLNRCFAPPYTGAEGEIARELLEALRARPCEALVDLHNTSGHSPAYGVSCRTDPEHIGLAALFAERLVHYDLHIGALTEVADLELPAVTIECGRAGDPAADATALAGLRRYAGAEHLMARPADPTDAAASAAVDAAALARVALYGSPLRVRVRPGVRLAFGAAPAPDADFTLATELDRHNFEQLPAGTRLGWLAPGAAWPLEASGATDQDVSRTCFVAREGRLETLRALVPIMMTTSREVAQSDCLFYAVEPRPAPALRVAARGHTRTAPA